MDVKSLNVHYGLARNFDKASHYKQSNIPRNTLVAGIFLFWGRHTYYHSQFEGWLHKFAKACNIVSAEGRQLRTYELQVFYLMQ